MSTTDTGRRAEAAVSEYLRERDFKVLEQNWRTRFCEIDVIARKAKVIYFVEVKYRQTARQGSGFEYITAKKLNQMQFAAENWVREHDWAGGYQLAAAEVGGNDFRVTNFIEVIY